eukprot:3898544-Prymnesium_polylepis.1
MPSTAAAPSGALHNRGTRARGHNRQMAATPAGARVQAAAVTCCARARPRGGRAAEEGAPAVAPGSRALSAAAASLGLMR